MKCKVIESVRVSRCSHFPSVLVLIALLTVAACSTTLVRAEEPSIAVNNPQKAEQSEQGKPKSGLPPEKSSRGTFVVVPIPTSSPAFGNGATVVAGYIFPLRKSDEVSPPSIIGGAWLGTDNGTRAWVAATELYFNQDRYHVITGFAHGDLNYDFYGTGMINGDAGVKFGLNQTGDVYFAEGLRRTFGQFFIGPRLWFGRSKLEPQHFSDKHPDLPPLDVELQMNALGFKIERDTTPNRFYPEEGTLFRFGSDFFAEGLGGTYTFQRYIATFNSYGRIGKKQILAYNLFACSTSGDAPFFGECIFGMQNELRGYPAGRYIDMKMLATQAEYRMVLPWRLGVAVFGGLGEVANSWPKFNAGNILPSGGIGPRFLLSGKYHVNLRADFAWGKNGNTFSMGVGESF